MLWRCVFLSGNYCWSFIWISHMHGQSNGTNLWVQTVAGKNKIIESRIQHKDKHVWWVMTDDPPTQFQWRPPNCFHCWPHAGAEKTTTADPPPLLSTSCFSCLSPCLCLYNPSCVWGLSNSYYIAAIVPQEPMTIAAHRRSTLPCERCCSGGCPAGGFWHALTSTAYKWF